ncbi:YdeI/OmpD-associated family protein [Enterococcus sp. BWM-S5]|uniref:YdeI/OmpD-associated family protein n=1 Tax=Enterococcus larvae TaxID=2794352 RepID=A0ABS4CFC0_9ENTE|nr:YdeI/OmpD-associated family protein [Enterococcus larvae]MBP1044918.1 YdeI/OmpD-associated family protein [Enterococcus larvae]
MVRSITEKLQLTKYEKKMIIQRPSADYFSDLLFDETSLSDQSVDLIIAFVKDMEEFKQLVDEVKKKKSLKENGLLYVAYPKKGNKMYETYVHRDEIFPSLHVNEEDGYIEGTSLKFNRMVSLDEVFTIVGIKNIVKKNTKKTKSQTVHDYTALIPQVEAVVSASPKAGELFATLTPGYKRGWAQYIFSAKQKATQEKRIKEMIDLLEKGFKSKELYRQSIAQGENQ